MEIKQLPWRQPGAMSTLKRICKLAVMAHAFNTSTQEAVADRSPEFKDSLVYKDSRTASVANRKKKICSQKPSKQTNKQKESSNSEAGKKIRAEIWLRNSKISCDLRVV